MKLAIYVENIDVIAWYITPTILASAKYDLYYNFEMASQLALIY